MEFPTLFQILRARLSDGYDVPLYCRDLFAQITDVTEDEWGTPKDPATKITNENTLRTFAKRGLTAKFAKSIVYRLNPDNLANIIGERPQATRELLADDLKVYAPEVDAGNVGTIIAGMLVDIIRRAAGLVPKDALEQEKLNALFVDLKKKYGDYLYEECDGYCPFPGCGKRLSVVNNSKINYVYEVSLVDKKKAATAGNLIALCPMCHGTYQLDDSKAKVKELAGVKALLSAHDQSTRLLDSIALEKNIVGVIKKVALLQEKELANAQLDPKDLAEKINPKENFILYSTVKNFVTIYFLRIQDIMVSLDKRGIIDYDAIQDQMHAIYKRLKKASKTQMEIFSEITEKIHRTSLQENVYCQIIVCYFIQKCEVFDAVAE